MSDDCCRCHRPHSPFRVRAVCRWKPVCRDCIEPGDVVWADLPNGQLVGDRVVDREEGDELLVVELHPETRADRYEIGLFGDTTVAEQNPHYDPAAPVVEAVYIDDVEETLDNWRSVEDVRDAVAFDAVTAYSFPADRLRGVDE